MPHASIVDRIHYGRSTVVIGGMPELPDTIAVVRVRCDLPGRLRPLERACARIERLLDGESPPRDKVLTGDLARPIAARFTTACNRLAARAPGHVVLALDGVDAAGPESHALLAQLLREPAKFRLPLLLISRDEPPESFRPVVDALERGAPSAPDEDDQKPDTLMKRVLRVAALAGAESFSANAVARVLAISTDEVLDALQQARDEGVAVREHGGDRFSLPPRVAQMLAASTLPSLRARWLERLGAGASSGETHAPPAGLEERLDGVARLVRAGDTKNASEELGRILDAIDALPASAEASRLSARAMLERARLRWLGAGVDPTFTLDGAFEAALAARAAIGELATPALRADVAAVIAGIAYDLGDGASVERAEHVLTGTIATLLQSGATADAASLLNDEAALALRLGQGKKARDLAARSLALSGARVKEAPNDAAARADLAATHHLLSRMPLHGSTDDGTPTSIEAALAHAKDAEAEYRSLAMRRDVGRVVETRARLEAKRGNIEAARAGFDAALRLADETADLTGLARVTEGLAELLTSTGKPRDALGLLASSIELNREKASPVGLAFDERALAHIEDAVAAMRVPDAELAAELKRTQARLARALELEGSEVTSWNA